MIGRCKDCRYWEPMDARFYPHAIPADWRQCRRVSLLNAAGYAAGQVWLESGHDYAELRTAPDFGCVEFTAKEAA